MNIYKPTKQEIISKLTLMGFNARENLHIILNNNPLKNKSIDWFEKQLVIYAKLIRGKNQKEYAKSCNKIYMHFLRTGEVKSIIELEDDKQNKQTKIKEIISRYYIQLVIDCLIKSNLIKGNSKDLTEKVYDILNK